MTQLDFSAPGPETRWLLLTTRSQPSFYIFFLSLLCFFRGFFPLSLDILSDKAGGGSEKEREGENGKGN